MREVWNRAALCAVLPAALMFAACDASAPTSDPDTGGVGNATPAPPVATVGPSPTPIPTATVEPMLPGEEATPPPPTTDPLNPFGDDIEALTPDEIDEIINSLPPTAAGSESGYCPAMEKNATAEQCAAFTNLVTNAALGVAALGAADEMRVGQTYPVRLIVGKKVKQDQIEAAAGSAGAVTTGDLKLAPWICGTLNAPNFDVTGELRQCQERGASSQVSFEWEVSPQLPRELSLSAKAESRAGKDGDMLDQVDSAIIKVKVDAGAKWKVDRWMNGMTESLGGLRNLLLALLAVIGVVGTIIWRARKIWKNPDADPNAEKTSNTDGSGIATSEDTEAQSDPAAPSKTPDP